MIYLQAVNGFTRSTKVALLSTLIADPHTNARLQKIGALGFAIQWFIMPELYIRAPFPYFHMLTDLKTLLECDTLKKIPHPGDIFAPVKSKTPPIPPRTGSQEGITLFTSKSSQEDSTI